MKLLLTVLAALSFQACKTTASYNNYVNEFVGRSMDEVINTYGTPSAQLHIKNSNVFVYEKDFGSKGIKISEQLTVNKNRNCKTSFYFDSNDKVESVKFDGTYCKR